MSFKMKYNIGKDLLQFGKRRSGNKMPRVKFVVLHDVGNDGLNKKTGRKNGTTARNNISYYRNTPNISASAHAFIDDKEILECIPATVGAPEKAWHVLYNVRGDNQHFGGDANDIAIGTELCYYPEDKARSKAAYDKFVWYNAYLAYHFKLDVNKCFIGHEHLDKGRKSDPSNGLKWIGKKYDDLVKDIAKEYAACMGKSVVVKAPAAKAPVVNTTASKNQIGVVEILASSLNVRSEASLTSPIVKQDGKDKALVKGTRWKVYGIKNGLYQVGTNQWISAGQKYTKYTPV